ncbi:hypothetical protein A3J23_01700 [Candidatus Peregrinibacteria bacterium RIFCSPLOWO2_02_FULL_48_14]|nr:MAG: hypothetical protein A3J23_01700 [Candidatus Peregrinibacteria bacterium RIFCSPLOWO2_02_FULL_48_14]
MNTAVLQKNQRTKVNFMLDKSVFEEIKTFVPDGERSDFANEAFREALETFRLRKFSEGLDALRESCKKTFTNKEILETIHEGRK